ncbi:MAG: tRNA (adenosine(37)-N6)-threonylcarbamoyltransferase complex dimerization subunit type 1 TsaB [Chloroflexota bacterium]
MLLAIDTATRELSIALHDGDTLIGEYSWLAGNRHTTALAPALNSLLDACNTPVDELSALAVATGPGSFTGLRIGMSLVKGLAAARKLPLVGASTLDILAFGQPFYQSGSGLIAVVQAGRGRIIVNSYRWSKGRWNSRSEPRLMEWEDLLATIDGPAYITGEIDTDGMEAITAVQQANESAAQINVAPPANRLRRAGYLAEHAWEQLRAAGEDRSAFDPAKVLPVYIQTTD